MITRRKLLSTAIVMGTAAGTGASGGRPLPTNERSPSGHYRPPHRVGMGGVTLGNGFKPTTDAQAQGALEAACAAGVRYYSEPAQENVRQNPHTSRPSSLPGLRFIISSISS